MLARLRKHLSYANVVATLALFAALAGGSYAAMKLPAHSVGTAQLKNRSVTKPKLARKLLAELKGKTGATGAQGPEGPRGSTGPAGSNASITGVAAGGDLTGAYPNPSIKAGAVTTGKFDPSAVAPDAAELGGLTPDQYFHAVGRGDASAAGEAAGGGDFTILTIPNTGEVHANCLNPAQAQVTYKNISGQDQRVFVDNGSGGDPTYTDPFADGSSTTAVTTGTGAGSAKHVTYFIRGVSNQTLSVLTVFETVNSGGGCFWFPVNYRLGSF